MLHMLLLYTFTCCCCCCLLGITNNGAKIFQLLCFALLHTRSHTHTYTRTPTKRNENKTAGENDAVTQKLLLFIKSSKCVEICV